MNGKHTHPPGAAAPTPPPPPKRTLDPDHQLTADGLRRRATRQEALDRAAKAICILDGQTRWEGSEDDRAHYRQLADAALHVALIEPGEAPAPPPAPEDLPLDISTERALAHLLQTLTDRGYDDATVGPLATLRERLETRAHVRATEGSA